MKSNLGSLIFFVAIIAFCFVVARFKFNECKKVGHSTTYCVLFNGK